MPGYMAHPEMHPESWRRFMRHGNHGSDVAAWQATLTALDYDITDTIGVFGDSTHNMTMAFQRLRELGIDGVVGPESKRNITTPPMVRVYTRAETDTRGLMQFAGCTQDIPFLRAQHYTPAQRTAIDLVVLHSMEGAEAATKAETVAAWFAGANARFPAPKSSAHFAVDCDSMMQMVAESDVAWAAPGANHNGVHIEHAGRKRQTAKEWRDAFSEPMLMQSAWLTATLCIRWDIPIVLLTRDELSSGRRGITTHAEVTHAFRKSTHTDPGPGFPTEWYLACVREAAAFIRLGDA